MNLLLSHLFVLFAFQSVDFWIYRKPVSISVKWLGAEILVICEVPLAWQLGLRR